MTTLTLHRPNQDITVELQAVEEGRWVLIDACDENGLKVDITPEEWEDVIRRALDGLDESGEE